MQDESSTIVRAAEVLDKLTESVGVAGVAGEDVPAVLNCLLDPPEGEAEPAQAAEDCNRVGRELAGAWLRRRGMLSSVKVRT